MKEFKSRHKIILEEIETQRFIDETVVHMLELDIQNPYPANKEKYETFVKEGIDEAAKYDLDTEQHCFAFLLAWHVLGEKILQNQELMDKIRSEKVLPEVKDEILMEVVNEELEKQKRESDGN